ncbi:protein LLP homolog [Paramacrobiotus metropolitanus]|uniref:protein LLP homolog n=1 Tax=Paramacrobiotus metropolitanus TaxID=2943436 RepID=UPI00244626AA|nr:protein LLP homolog [Paramacrobiotus metropolitanus]
MAKSMRSKVKRKNRAVKREKYAQRELERLKKTTARIQLPSHLTPDQEIKKEMLDPADVFPGLPSVDDDSIMEVECVRPRNKAKFKLNPKSLKNEHGNYPGWMSQRRIQQLRNCGKRKGKSKGFGRKKIVKRLSK